MNLAQSAFDNAESEGKAGVGINAFLNYNGADMQKALRFELWQAVRLVVNKSCLVCNWRLRAAYISKHRL